LHAIERAMLLDRGNICPLPAIRAMARQRTGRETGHVDGQG